MESKKKPQLSSKPSPKSGPDYLKHSGIAFELVAYNLLMVWAGYKLDEYFEFEIPWMIILGALLAVVGTIYYLIKRLSS
ncbi:MAG: AtpZ/AtpI family protein [Cyclobacteriaceae bacterium]|nr:AtpZ/AtpI family protein [Cyclobacteriaceae bacterium HetDA_MAG_MS6]